MQTGYFFSFGCNSPSTIVSIPYSTIFSSCQTLFTPVASGRVESSLCRTSYVTSLHFDFSLGDFYVLTCSVPTEFYYSFYDPFYIRPSFLAPSYASFIVCCARFRGLFSLRACGPFFFFRIVTLVPPSFVFSKANFAFFGLSLAYSLSS